MCARVAAWSAISGGRGGNREDYGGLAVADILYVALSQWPNAPVPVTWFTHRYGRVQYGRVGYGRVQYGRVRYGTVR